MHNTKIIFVTHSTFNLFRYITIAIIWIPVVGCNNQSTDHVGATEKMLAETEFISDSLKRENKKLRDSLDYITNQSNTNTFKRPNFII